MRNVFIVVNVFNAALLLPLFATQVDAQSQHAHRSTLPSSRSVELAAFVSAARAGTERYRDRNAAISAGFRKLGRDFPSMGEHWAHPGKVISGKFDVGDPAMLTYAMIDGKPVLLGAVYAIPLEAGQSPPALPDGIEAWHEHNGTVDEESFLPEHGGKKTGTAAGTRLAILHVWTLLPNPGGDFAAENWALPFARLHLERPEHVPEGAARALSLVAGAGEFYSGFLEIELPASREREWRAALTAASASARSVVRERVSANRLSPLEISALQDAWVRFADSVSSFSPAVGKRLGGNRHAPDSH